MDRFRSCSCISVQLELEICKTRVVAPFPISNSAYLLFFCGAGDFSQWCRFAKMVGLQPQYTHSARTANGRGERSVPAVHCCLWKDTCPENTRSGWKFHHPRSGWHLIPGHGGELEPHAEQLPVSTAGFQLLLP